MGGEAGPGAQEAGEAGGTFRFTGDRGQFCCSFCGKPHNQVPKMIAGTGVYICSECIALCVTILQDEAASPSTFRLAVRRPDGSEETVEVLDVQFSVGDRGALDFCFQCGTWRAGQGWQACPHCGASR